ncbi:MAG: ATP-binding protein [Deltaproteobacteria bacterium]|nr:ATP-binding protein [Deltaproteobacteria bacterium]
MRLTESENLELKKSTGELKAGIISLAAMLNKHQRGELWFGIKNNGTAVGQSISEASLREVSRAIGEHIDPKVYPTVEQVMVDEKPCIRVLVEGKDAPYFCIRQGLCPGWRRRPAVERQGPGGPDPAKEPRSSPLGYGNLRSGGP